MSAQLDFSAEQVEGISQATMAASLVSLLTQVDNTAFLVSILTRCQHFLKNSRENRKWQKKFKLAPQYEPSYTPKKVLPSSSGVPSACCLLEKITGMCSEVVVYREKQREQLPSAFCTTQTAAVSLCICILLFLRIFASQVIDILRNCVLDTILSPSRTLLPLAIML